MTNAEVPIEVDVHQVHQWLGQRDDLVLIDCREKGEYETAKIEGAILIPLSELKHRTAELEAFRSKHVVVHCHHGGRSLRMAMYMRQNGFATAQNMAGGIDQWATDIDSTVPRY